MVEKFLAVFFAVSMLVGCESMSSQSTQDMSSNPSAPKESLATLRVVSEERSGNTTRRATIESIDGKSVVSAGYVTVDPGTHVLSVSYYKRVDPEGMNPRITLNLFGHESTLREPDPSMVFTTNSPNNLLVVVQAGRSYHISNTDSLHRVSDFEVRGSWTPELVEDSSSR